MPRRERQDRPSRQSQPAGGARERERVRSVRRQREPPADAQRIQTARRQHGGIELVRRREGEPDPGSESKQSERDTEAHRGSPAQEQNEKRPREIEMLFDRERPEVAQVRDGEAL